jgi:hypothetical protein
MNMYFVGTLVRYVLVEADDEAQAKQRALPALHDLYADARAELGGDIPINIRTVRPATDDEIDQWNWHQEMMARYAK